MPDSGTREGPTALTCTAKKRGHTSALQAARCPFHGWRSRRVEPSEMLKVLPSLLQRQREEVARLRHTDPAVLEHMAQNRDDTLIEHLALNPAMPQDALRRLWASDDAWLMARIASNTSTPVEVLESALASRDRSIRQRLASNPSLPRSGVAYLTETAAGSVLVRLAGRPDLTAEEIESLVAAPGRAAEDLQLMAREAGTRPEVLMRLALVDASPVHEHLARNVNLPAPAVDALRLTQPVVAALAAYQRSLAESVLERMIDVASESGDVAALHVISERRDCSLRLLSRIHKAAPEVNAIRRAVDTNICDLLGVHPNNEEALDMLRDTQWWALSRESDTVYLALIMSPNPS